MSDKPPTRKQLERALARAVKAREAAAFRAQNTHLAHGEALDALNTAFAEQEYAQAALNDALRPAAAQAPPAPAARDETLCVPEDEE